MLSWLSGASVLHMIQAYGLWIVFAGVMLESIGVSPCLARRC